jgi:hypothetical protein
MPGVQVLTCDTNQQGLSHTDTQSHACSHTLTQKHIAGVLETPP